MTEAEWLTSEDHFRMAYAVAKKMSLRKLRLAQVAICRRIEHHLTDERSRRALEVSEGYAEGLVSEVALTDARAHADAAYQSLFPHSPEEVWRVDAALAACCAAGTESDMRMDIDMIDLALGALERSVDSIPSEQRSTNVADADLLRDIFGNPFRPVTFNPEWRTSTAVALAKTMYDAREFGNLPILADALQDAGCENAYVLDHCRGPGPHVRGCWVVDLVLGKE